MNKLHCIRSDGGYPAGAEFENNCPWNEKSKEKIEVDVTVSVTYSKTLKVVIEEGYELPDLIEAVQEMKVLPNDILKERVDALNEDLETNDWLLTGKRLDEIKQDIKRCSPWHEDELEVIPNE